MAEGCYGRGTLWLRDTMAEDAMVEVYYMAGQTMAEDDYTEKLMAGRTWLWRARVVAAGQARKFSYLIRAQGGLPSNRYYWAPDNS